MSFKTIWRALLPLLGVWLLSATAANAMFLSADPIGTKDDPNLYLYVGLDPVNKADPTGLAGCGTGSANTSLGRREGLSSSQCTAWMGKQAQGLRDIAATRAGLAAWQRNPDSRAGRNFARAMTSAFGEGALSDENIGNLGRNLNNLESFFRDPGTARGGQHDVYLAAGQSGGGIILGGRVSFGAGYFTTNTMSEYSKRATIHEPLHIFGYGADRAWLRPDGYYGNVSGPESDMWYAREVPRGAKRNADNWACLMVQSCGGF